MCSGAIETAEIDGSAKGAQGWFPLRRVQVAYDHPYNAQMNDALIIDFVNPERSAGARVAVELSAQSARALIHAIEAALLEGERRRGQVP